MFGSLDGARSGYVIQNTTICKIRTLDRAVPLTLMLFNKREGRHDTNFDFGISWYNFIEADLKNTGWMWKKSTTFH